MNLIQAIVIGVIQGLTEFLPISSTAHIRVIPSLLGWDDPGAAFTAVIQWGTWFAVVVYFWRDILRLLVAVYDDLLHNKLCRTPESRLAWMIVAGTIPIVVLGLAFHKYIEGALRSLYVIAAAAIVMALLLWAAEWYARRGQLAQVPPRDLHEMSWADAIVIGLWQSVALIPGASRSGSTITGGLFSGLSRPTAARYSFLLSLPSVFGAGVHQLIGDKGKLLGSGESVLNLVVATIVSGIVGYYVIVYFIEYLKKHTTYIFIGYRIALGIFLIAMLQAGKLSPLPPGSENDKEKKAEKAAVVSGVELPEEQRLGRPAQGNGFPQVVPDVVEQAIPGLGIGGQERTSLVEIGLERGGIHVGAGGIVRRQSIDNGGQCFGERPATGTATRAGKLSPFQRAPAESSQVGCRRGLDSTVAC